MERIHIHQMGGGGYAVATHDLYDLIGSKIKCLIADRDGPGLSGVAENLALRYEDASANSIKRRLYDLHTQRSKSLRHTLAELLVDELTGMRLDDKDVATLPRSIHSALEMVEVWTDLTGIEAHRLAHSLYNFANGYVTTFDEAADIVAAHEAKLAGRAEDQDAIAVAA